VSAPPTIRRVNVSVRLFAMLRESAGRDEIDLDLDEGATVSDALEALGSEPKLGELLERMPVRMAVNRDYATPETELSPGDELALVPPVSGGAEAVIRVRVTGDELSLDKLANFVKRPAAGAVVVFEGTTREVPRLEYEAYREMAEEKIAEILTDCIERHGLEAAAAEHRIGAVPLSRPSVIVAVSAPHREEAFAGAREVIDRIKADVPIWKREVERTDDGGESARWVEGNPV
jgi:molybdopterin converting factor subunit 1